MTSSQQADVLFQYIDNGNIVAINHFFATNPSILTKQIRDVSVFKYCVERGDIELIKTVIYHIERLSSFSGEELFFDAAKNGDIDKLNFLLKYGLNINRKNSAGYTPLLLAVLNNKIDTVKFLLYNRAKVDILDKKGLSVMHYAVLSKNIETINLLLLKSATLINKIDCNGQTPLHYASIYGFDEVAKTLVNNGARLKTFDITGKTPANYAKENRFYQLAEFLTEESNLKPY